MNKIQKLSRFFKIALLLVMAGVIIFPIITWLSLPEKITPQLIKDGILTFGGLIKLDPFFGISAILYPFTLGHKLLGLTIKMIPTSTILFALFYLYRLFINFEKNIIFEMDNVKLIRKSAIWLLIGQALMPLYDALMTFSMTVFNPHGFRMFSITLTSGNLGITLLALLTLLISWIMLEAVKLRDENQAFV